MQAVLLPRDSDVKRQLLIELSLGDTRYMLSWPEHFDSPELNEASLLTVFDYDREEPVGLDWIHNKVEEYNTKDDVFRLEFLESVLFLYSSNTILEVSESARNFLHSKGTKKITRHRIGEQGIQIAPGPYYYSDKTLRPLWRLYEDDCNAFLHALVLDQHRQPFKLQTAGHTARCLAIAVPTKIKSHRSQKDRSEPSLQGWRVAVKDNFNIKSLRTSLCNRAYYELYPPAESTAACIQTLYDHGAFIVGTTKLASFAATEEPMECIDWQAPFNPRGDRYQSPAGSSSGSGSASAAYPWLDITVGSDTSGSGRRPGLWNGCFAMRPSHGYLSHKGLVNSFPRFDVPTFFARDLVTCKRFSEAWYGWQLPTQVSAELKPLSIIYASDYMDLIGNKIQLDLIQAFVADLEKTFNVQHERVSFEQVWGSDPPSKAEGESLSEYMRDASLHSFFYEDYHNFDAFRMDYRKKFGRDAYISPPVRWQWELSSTISPESYEEAMRRLEVYKEWFYQTIMKSDRQITLILLPIEEIAPRYRDEMPKNHFKPVGVPNLFLSPILKTPELTVPIGSFPYLSKASGIMEKLPVAISIVGPPGQDIALIDMVLTCMRSACRSHYVLPGRELF